MCCPYGREFTIHVLDNTYAVSIHNMTKHYNLLAQLYSFYSDAHCDCAVRILRFSIENTLNLKIRTKSVCTSSGFYIRIGTDSIRTQKSIRNLIVTKIKTSEQKQIVTIEFLRKSTCGCTICRLDYIMRTTVKALKNLCQDSCAYGNSPDH